MVRRLLSYLGKYKIYAVFCVVCVGLEVVCELLQPLLMSRIIDMGIANRDAGYIAKISICMIGLAILGLLFGALSARLSAVAGQGFGNEIRKAEFEKIQSFSFSNIDRFSTSSLVTRLTSDVTTVQGSVTMGMRLLVRAPLMMVLAMITAISINSRLAGIFLIAVPVLAICVTLILNKALPLFTKMQENIDNLNRVVQENLIGVRVVKSFGRQGFEKEKFAARNQILKNTAQSAMRLAMLNMPVMMLIMYGCIMAILWFGGQMVMVDDMGTGELVSFISYVTQILISLMMISMMFIMLVRSKASGARILEVIDTEADLSDIHVSEDTPVASGDVEFRDVTFSYHGEEGENVLENINLSIKQGQVVGIIGSTGSAKTTLVSLIPRLYDAGQGEVLVGGRNVKDYKLDTLRGAVSMVLQQNTLFSGTIRDNLRWGNENATDQELEDACKAACAHGFITSFPDGYDTELGQGGVNVSGGQKQRLCIARALLKNPKVLILDDSTSAVDTATEASIRATFANMPDVTIIIIAQRVTSVMEADQIVVMNEGQIDAVGVHDELLASNEIYREVYTTQQEGASL